MALVSNIQLQDSAVKPPNLDANLKYTAAGLTATEAIAVGAVPVSTSGAITVKSANDIRNWIQTTKTDGNVEIYMSNDARPDWALRVAGTADNAFVIANSYGNNCTAQFPAFSIGGAGAVGLGKTGATNILDIAYKNSATGGIQLTETQNSVGMKLIAEATSGSIGSTSNHKLGFRVNGTTVAAFNTSTQFGIGTDSPGATLDVRGAAIFNEAGAAVDFRIEGDTNQNLFFVDGSSDRVGIGSSVPDELLNVFASGNANIKIKSSGAGAATLFDSPADEASLIQFSSAGTQKWKIQKTATTEALDIRNSSDATKVTLLDSGNLGIGTATPGGLLHLGGVDDPEIRIQGAADGDPQINFYQGASTCRGTIMYKDTGDNFVMDSAGKLTLQTSSTPRLVITNAGCVGIGTSAIATCDSAELDVFSTTNTGIVLRTSNTSAASSSILGEGYRADADAEQVLQVVGRNKLNKIELGIFEVSAEAKHCTGALEFKTFDGSSMTTKMKITSAGCVGVGTAVPNAMLQVDGSAIFNDGGGDNDFRVEGDNEANLFFVDASTDRVGIGTNTPASELEISHNDLTTTLTLDNRSSFVAGCARTSISFEAISDADSRSQYAAINAITTASTHGAGELQFITRKAADGATSESMRIDDAGNVGIGTLTPAAALHVVGSVCVTGDLTIGGDDLVMGTNTAGHILVADGTNYNPVAVSGDITINSAGAVTIAATSVENSMLAGSIANAKLSNSSVSYGGISVALGAADATPAFNLCDATAYKTSNLAGTITNAQLAGSIANAKLANDSVSYGGISLDLGATDASPAFNLCDATGYKGDSALVTAGALNSGSITSGFGNIDNGSSSLTTGAATVSSLSVGDGNITNVGDIAVDTISGDGDANTTIGFPGSDVLTFNTGGSESFRINAAGCIGIGTTAPQSRLDIAGAGGGAPSGAVPAGGVFIRATDTNTVGQGAVLRLQSTCGSKENAATLSAVNVSGNNGDLAFNMYAGGASHPERMRLTSAGNFGVGTNAPEHTIQAFCSADVAVIEVATDATDGNPALRLKNDAQEWQWQLRGAQSDSLVAWDVTGGAGRLYLTTGGFLGIGTTAPVAAFHVNNGASVTNLPGNTRAVFANGNGADAITRVGIYAGGASAFSVLDLGRNDANCRSSLTYNASADSLTIGTAGSTSAFSMLTSGVIGIGTAAPASQLIFSSAPGLQVQGSIGAAGYMITQNGIYIGLAPNDANEGVHIDDSSNGGGSTALFIGNAQISVSSDRRVKNNIQCYTCSAVNVLNNARVVEFEYDRVKMNDKSDFGPSSRGKYVGLIAQEMIEYARWAINDGEGDPEGEHIWKAEYEHMVPLLIKAVQELNERIVELESAA